MLSSTIDIFGTLVGGELPPYIIAEIGSNFDQDYDKARRLIDVAAESGANAVKFQLFQADVLYPNKGEIYNIFKSVELNPDWVPHLYHHAKSQSLHFMASAFDAGSLELLDNIGVPAHKIASSETTNLGFVHKVASAGLPTIISTGMCDMVDVEEAINICLGAGNSNIALLQCGAVYPLDNDLVNLRVIQAFASRFNCPVGFSDHTINEIAAITAVGLGATIFEKHITLDKKSKGPDHFYAIEPDELKLYVRSIRQAHQSLGSREKRMLPKEREVGRREGIYFSRPVKAGSKIVDSDLIVRRPALGLRSRYISSVVGAVLTQDVGRDDPLTWDLLKFA